MSDTHAACEVMTAEATNAVKLGFMDNDSCSTGPNNGSGVNAQTLGDSRAEEDNGEASDESSSRRESNSSADGNEYLETQQTNNEEDSDLQDTTTQTPRKRKKKRRSKRRSRANSFTDTPNPPTDLEPLLDSSTPQPAPDPTTNDQITQETPNPDTTTKDNIQQETSDATIDTDINVEITEGTTDNGITNDGINTAGEGNTPTDDGATKDVTMEDDTTNKTDTDKPNKGTTDTSNPTRPASTLGVPMSPYRASSSSSITTTTNSADFSHIPQHLLDLTPPPTRGRSNAFYGTRSPPPLLHSHSDGAAIVAQHNTSAAISPRRNTVGLGITVTPTIPEPAHSGISKPKMFTWRVSTPSYCAFLPNFGPGPILDKSVLSHSKRFLVGFAETIGRRPTMEDCMVVHGAFRGHGHEDYFALFDGHGGRDAAAFAAEHLHEVLAEKLKTNNAVKSLKEAFADTNQMISDQKIIGGTTAVVALFIGKKGFIANVGDTRAVLCRDGVPLRVSLDHKPELPTESQRIKNLGGTVTTTYNSAGQATSRVNGMLAVSRALGDIPLQPYVSSDPEIHGPLNLDTESRDQFVVLACDGVWDVLTDEEATSIVAPIANPEIASRRLRDEAFARGSTDNISVMVIRCPPFVPCD